MPAISKGQMRTRQQDKASRKYQHAKARKACVDAVWDRERVTVYVARCQGCRRIVRRDVEAAFVRGHVHEKRARSLGGNPHDPDQCLLLCHDCHFNGPSGAHRRSETALGQIEKD